MTVRPPVQADLLHKQLMNAEERLLEQQKAQAEQKQKTKAQKKAARRTKLALEQIRANQTALAESTATAAYKAAAGQLKETRGNPNSKTVRAVPGRLRGPSVPSRFSMKINFLWGFCMGAQGA